MALLVKATLRAAAQGVLDAGKAVLAMLAALVGEGKGPRQRRAGNYGEGGRRERRKKETKKRATGTRRRDDEKHRGKYNSKGSTPYTDHRKLAVRRRLARASILHLGLLLPLCDQRPTLGSMYKPGG